MTQPPGASRPLILLVEPDASIRMLARRMLERHGYAILEARDADSAAVQLQSCPSPIALLLTELELPDAPGRELAEQAVREGRRIPVLYSSAMTLPGDPDFDMILPKPYSMNELVAKVRSVLESKGARPPMHRHSVRIYDDDDGLALRVAEYLGAGLSSGEAVRVIAVPEHWEGISRRMVDDGVDLHEVQRSGQVKFIDARATLGRVTTSELPDRSKLNQVVGELVGPLHAFRIYGELVDLLWQDGQLDEALRLEGYWDEILGHSDGKLLCGYAMNLSDEVHGAAFARVSEAHAYSVL